MAERTLTFGQKDGVYKKLLSEYDIERLKNPQTEYDKEVFEALPDEAKKKILIQYHTAWIVRQFENEYNPLHLHTGSVSGVCYTMVLFERLLGANNMSHKCCLKDLRTSE